jgi:hypothetical protein
MGVTETASSAATLHARFRSGPASNRNRASQRRRAMWRHEMRFPVLREDGDNASARCLHSAEVGAGSPSREERVARAAYADRTEWAVGRSNGRPVRADNHSPSASSSC